jgi:phytoene dehydrogenase-like protein
MVGYDAIVVGAGHNGLVAGAYLAKAGLRTLILERRAIVGGACVTEEVHPGFRVSSLSYTCGLFRPEIKEDLQLKRFGLEEHVHDPAMFLPFPDGRHILWRPDAAWNLKEVARFSEADAEALPKYEAFWEGFAELVEPTLLAPPVSLADLAALVTTPEAEDFLRKVLLMSVQDVLDDYFESEEVKVSLGTSAVSGTMAGPRTPGTAFVLGHHSLGTIGGQRGVWGWAKGGMGAISESIASAARHFGAEVRTGAGVSTLLTRDGAATGVRMADGTELESKVVLSGLDPKRTFLGLVGEDRLPADFVHAIEHYRMESSSFKLNLALKGLPDFRAVPGTNLQLHHKGLIDIAPDLGYLERAYEDAVHGRWSREPYLELCLQSAVDPTVAPKGMHTLTASCKFAPFDLANGTWNTEGEKFAEAILDTLEAYGPNLRGLVIAKSWITPLDLEREYGLTRGDAFHGAILPYQMFSFRPVPGWARYRTPVERFYLCSAGAHPGAGVLGAPGHNAAMAVLEDWPKIRHG